MEISTQEKIKMVYCLGESEGNCFLASRIYAQKYPEARHPHQTAFQRLKNIFEETGSVKEDKRQRVRPVNNEENAFSVLLSITENPHVSTRDLSRQLDISQSTVSKIIRTNKFHPYHIQLLQELNEADFARRNHFCNWALNKITEQHDFFENVLFSDEATFHNNGNINKHNLHYYANENPHFHRSVQNQNRWSLNVWGGIVGGHVVGPHFFGTRLNSAEYLNFLRNILPDLFENLPLGLLGRMWLQHDGSPVHYSAEVRNYLDEEFPNRWIGRGGPVEWPPRSPDLTKIDFFLWGYVKEKVFQTPPNTREDMIERIREAFQSINHQTLSNVSRSFTNRLRLCLQQNGGHFEHL